MNILNQYGIMTIQKDTVLYISAEKKNFKYSSSYFCEIKNKILYQKRKKDIFLFCNFHPSESNYLEKYIHFLKVKKDIKILFMVKKIRNNTLLSAIDDIIQYKKYISSKKNLLKEVSKNFIENNLDGWFCSIRSGVRGFKNVEIALLNNYELYEIIKTTKLEKDWKHSFIKNNEVIPKYWGEKYKICINEIPVLLNLNIRYKKMIEKYKKNEIKSGYIHELCFQILLDNAIIYYYN